MKPLLIKMLKTNAFFDSRCTARFVEFPEKGGESKLLRFLASVDLTAPLTTAAFANMLKGRSSASRYWCSRVLSSYI